MISRLFVCIVLLAFSQLPVFVDQYMIRLDGHLAESNRQVAAFQEAASVGGRTLDEYIAKFLEQVDRDFVVQGTLMQAAVERNRFLAAASSALHAATPLVRPAVCIRYVDSLIVVDAWNSFAPGVALTLDVGLWALIGLVVGWILVLAFRGLWHSISRRAEAPPPANKGT